MNKTAAFTSLTMLLSVAQYGFSAESAQRLQELAQSDPLRVAQLESQAQEARERYERTLTKDRTLYQLERLILPSYEGFEIKSMGISDLSFRALALGGSIGSGIAVPAGAKLAMTASAAIIGEWMHRLGRIARHNGYKKRASSTPILTIYEALIDDKQASILQIEERGKGDDKTTYFNMKTFEEYSKKMEGFYINDYLSKGGYQIINRDPEGRAHRRGMKWEPQRKIHGQIRVTMATPPLKNPASVPNSSDNRLSPEDFYKPAEINIWKCNGACDPEENSCNVPSCEDLIQTCISPSEEVRLRSFALSLCSRYIAIGCTNGAVMILHRNDDIAAKEGWRYCDAFEQRVKKPLTTYLADHINDLRSVKTMSPKEREDLQHALAIEGPPSL